MEKHVITENCRSVINIGYPNSYDFLDTNGEIRYYYFAFLSRSDIYTSLSLLYMVHILDATVADCDCWRFA
jgi:hypothetical protein